MDLVTFRSFFLGEENSRKKICIDTKYNNDYKECDDTNKSDDTFLFEYFWSVGMSFIRSPMIILVTLSVIHTVVFLLENPDFTFKMYF